MVANQATKDLTILTEINLALNLRSHLSTACIACIGGREWHDRSDEYQSTQMLTLQHHPSLAPLSITPSILPQRSAMSLYHRDQIHPSHPQTLLFSKGLFDSLKIRKWHFDFFNLDSWKRKSVFIYLFSLGAEILPLMIKSNTRSNYCENSLCKCKNRKIAPSCTSYCTIQTKISIFANIL